MMVSLHEDEQRPELTYKKGPSLTALDENKNKTKKGGQIYHPEDEGAPVYVSFRSVSRHLMGQRTPDLEVCWPIDTDIIEQLAEYGVEEVIIITDNGAAEFFDFEDYLQPDASESELREEDWGHGKQRYTPRRTAYDVVQVSYHHSGSQYPDELTI